MKIENLKIKKKLYPIENFFCRTCTECKKGMNEGFLVFAGDEYYCSEKCLYKNYSITEWKELHTEYPDDNYWTQWDIDEEYLEFLEEI